MSNRLAGATSPYLLQHKDNPVDWFEWGEDAFAQARRRDLPVLLSVGYAACHWCHVMAHESFEDAATAHYMNENFVNIKVDREERPDVDAVYMEATQVMTGHGGWPMTVICTPAGEPFFSGTYFPSGPRHGMPSFRQVLEGVTEAWRQRRHEVAAVGAQLVKRLGERGGLPSAGAPPDVQILDEAVQRLAQDFDANHGGFGGAPKFPPSMVLEFLLRAHARSSDPAALEIVERTCEAMARGGIYDQLGGGFARYSVDAEWVVPHFEKMLYDNALLLRAYVHLWRATGSALAARVVDETATFMVEELRTREGGFASSIDADSDGEEGRFYVWTPAQLREVLGSEVGAWASDLLRVTEEGTFEAGTSVLQLPEDPDYPQRWLSVRRKLAAVRADRVRPGRDDKVVAAWNGLAIAALCEAGALFERADWLAAATASADLLIAVHLQDGRLVRTSRDGKPGLSQGVLEDYADVAEGLLALFATTGDESWLTIAGVLLDVVLDHFTDGQGGFFDTADDAETLVRRPQDPTDGATPSGQSAAAGALLTYSAYTGELRYREAAERALGVVAVLGPQHARFAGWGLAVAEALVDGPREVAVIGPATDSATVALRRTALLGTAPGAAVAVGDPGQETGVALLRQRPLVAGKPAAYVCRHFVCAAPVTDVSALASAVGARLDLVHTPSSA